MGGGIGAGFRGLENTRTLLWRCLEPAIRERRSLGWREAFEPISALFCPKQLTQRNIRRNTTSAEFGSWAMTHWIPQRFPMWPAYAYGQVKTSRSWQTRLLEKYTSAARNGWGTAMTLCSNLACQPVFGKTDTSYHPCRQIGYGRLRRKDKSFPSSDGVSRRPIDLSVVVIDFCLLPPKAARSVRRKSPTRDTFS